MCVVSEFHALCLVSRRCHISYDNVYYMIQYEQYLRMLKGGQSGDLGIWLGARIRVSR
jgi:hypothetical protein